jgi:hypothetical protein
MAIVSYYSERMAIMIKASSEGVPIARPADCVVLVVPESQLDFLVMYDPPRFISRH